MLEAAATHFDLRAELPPFNEAALQPAKALAAAQGKRAAPLRGLRERKQSPGLQPPPLRPGVHLLRQLQPVPFT